MTEWIFKHLGIVVFLVIFISQIARALLNSRKTRAEHEAQRDDPSEARRVKEIQEQIRRQVAERRGGRVPTEMPPPFTRETEAAPIPRAETTQMPEPFGGPLGRMLEELQRRVQPQPVPVPPQLVELRNTGELERQQRIVDELKALEDARTVAQRRAEYRAEEKQAEADSEPVLRSAARERLLGDLSDPQSLRRAFVLREVLGTPVGLR